MTDVKAGEKRKAAAGGYRVVKRRKLMEAVKIAGNAGKVRAGDLIDMRDGKEQPEWGGE